MTTKALGIFGGTFDPIHLGHLHLANTVRNQCNLTKIIFIPCNQSPLRNPPVASNAARLAMLQLAIKEYPAFNLEDCELQAQQLSYTFTTLQKLRVKFGNVPLCLIMGIDAFCSFNHWYRWQNILELAHLIIANRPNAPQLTATELLELVSAVQVSAPQDLQLSPNGKIYFTDITPLPISATEIRHLIKTKQDPSMFLPKEVWHYIRANNLYS